MFIQSIKYLETKFNDYYSLYEYITNYFIEHKIIDVKISYEDIINIVEFKPANAIKVTIKRPICSGDIGEKDVYGAQQHAPFLDLEIDI